MIRRATPKDQTKLLALIRSFCDEIGADSFDLVIRLKTGKSTYLVDENLMGFCGYFKQNNFAIAEGLYVAPEQRGTRLAYQVFRAGEKDAQKNGCKTIKAFVHIDRAKIYQKKGYEQTHCLLEKHI